MSSNKLWIPNGDPCYPSFIDLPKLSKIFAQLFDAFLKELRDCVAFLHLWWKQRESYFIYLFILDVFIFLSGVQFIWTSPLLFSYDQIHPSNCKWFPRLHLKWQKQKFYKHEWRFGENPNIKLGIFFLIFLCSHYLPFLETRLWVNSHGLRTMVATCIPRMLNTYR